MGLAEIWLKQATDKHRAGCVREAEELYRKALEAQPTSTKALYFLGCLYVDEGDRPRGIALLRQAVALRPVFVEAHFSLGNALFAEGDMAGAEEAYSHAIALQPGLADAHFRLGLAQRNLGKTADAELSFRKAIALRPDNVLAFCNLGLLYAAQGRHEEAVTFFRQALAIRSDRADIYRDLGRSLCQLRRWQEAVDYQRRAIALAPQDAELYVDSGAALFKLERYDEAEEALRQAVRLAPDSCEAHTNLGMVEQALHKLDAAEASQRRAVQIKPDFAETRINLANILRARGKVTEAAEQYRAAVDLAPGHIGASFNLGMLSLMLGDYARGWPGYEFRLRTEEAPRRAYDRPRWDGAAMPGKTLLVCVEQGLGDTIQFVRFVQEAKTRSQARLILESQPPLVDLLANCAGVDEIQAVTPGEAVPAIAYDAHIPLLSLPSVFGVTLETIPCQVPYIPVPDRKRDEWATRLGRPDGLRVGLVWGGNPGFPDDRNRSCALSQLAPLGRASGVTFYALQKGEPAAQTQNPPAGMRLVDLSADLRDFTDTAGVIQNLDLVISTCTSVPHLAGALGAQVWTALQFAADWRWLLDREDSPWYPSMRLFRQPTPGDWRSVFARMAEELANLAPARR